MQGVYINLNKLLQENIIFGGCSIPLHLFIEKYTDIKKIDFLTNVFSKMKEKGKKINSKNVIKFVNKYLNKKKKVKYDSSLSKFYFKIAGNKISIHFIDHRKYLPGKENELFYITRAEEYKENKNSNKDNRHVFFRKMKKIKNLWYLINYIRSNRFLYLGFSNPRMPI